MRRRDQATGAVLLILCAVFSADGVSQELERSELPTDERARDGAEQPEQFSIPIRTVQSLEEAERALEESRRAEQRQESELEAQWVMAEASRQLVPISWWQAAFAGLGGVLLALSLFFSAWATRAAAAAARAAEDVLKAERAWVTPNEVVIMDIGDLDLKGVRHGKAVSFIMECVNSGRSPALDARIKTVIRIVGIDDEVPWFEPPKDVAEAGMGIIGPGVKSKGEVQHIHGSDLKGLLERRYRAFLYTRAEYSDVFDSGQRRVTESCIGIEFTGPANAEWRPEYFPMIAMGPQNTAI